MSTSGSVVLVAGLFSGVFASETPIEFDESKWVPIEFLVEDKRISTRVPANWATNIAFPPQTSHVIRESMDKLAQRSREHGGELYRKYLDSYSYDWRLDKKIGAKSKFSIIFLLTSYRGRETDDLKEKYFWVKQTQIKTSMNKNRTVLPHKDMKNISINGVDWFYGNISSTRVELPKPFSYFYTTSLNKSVLLQVLGDFSVNAIGENIDWKQRRLEVLHRVIELIRIEPINNAPIQTESG